jgi:exo-beta-1,3-glucanase (GH17 family)
LNTTNTETWHYLHTGTENSTAKGVKYVQVSNLNYWEGENVTRMGNTLVLLGALDPKKVESLVKITQFDVYGKEVPVTDYQIEVKNQDEKKLINPGTLLFSGTVGIFVIGIFKIAGVVL